MACRTFCPSMSTFRDCPAPPTTNGHDDSYFIRRLYETRNYDANGRRAAGSSGDIERPGQRSPFPDGYRFYRGAYLDLVHDLVHDRYLRLVLPSAGEPRPDIPVHDRPIGCTHRRQRTCLPHLGVEVENRGDV